MCKCQYLKYFELISSCVRHLPSNALQRQEMRNQFPSTFNLWWWSSKYCWWNRSIRGINAENSSEHARWCPVFVCLGLVEKYQPGEVNFVVTVQNCQHLQDITTKFSLCKICSEQSRGLCWGEMLRNLHILPQFVSFIWFLKTLQISIYLPRIDQNVLLRDRSNQWASKIQFQCQATAALFVGCWSKDSLSFQVLEHNITHSKRLNSGWGPHVFELNWFLYKFVLKNHYF